MKVEQIDHLNMTVENFEESAKWYSDVFGFKKVEQGLYKGKPWGVIRSVNTALCMYENPNKKRGPGDDLEEAKFHGISHFGFKIHDQKEWEASIDRNNLEIMNGGAVDWPNSQSWYLKDLNGYVIEVALWNDNEMSFDGI